MNWDEMAEKGEATCCKECGRKIGKYWHNKIKGEYPEMDKCGLCYFKRVYIQGGSA